MYNLGGYKVWNPWKGCFPVSEACNDCFIKHKGTFIDCFYDYCFETCEHGDVIAVCLQSDFFLKEADRLRRMAWDRIRKNSHLIFLIITKRPERIKDCLPEDWGDGYDNVVLCTTSETQARADERLPIVAEIPCKHRWITCCPLLEEIDLTPYLESNKFELVEILGEKSYHKEARPLEHSWVLNIREQCVKNNIGLALLGVGSNYHLDKDTILQDRCKCFTSPVAHSLELDYHIPISFNLDGSEFII